MLDDVRTCEQGEGHHGYEVVSKRMITLPEALIGPNSRVLGKDKHFHDYYKNTLKNNV